MSARAIAATVIQKVFAGCSLTQALADLSTNTHEMPLIQEMCYGVLRYAPRLTFMLNQLIDTPLKAKDSDVHALLLLGLYQLIYMHLPDYAVVTETVAASQSLKKIWAKNLVNAVLRNFTRKKDALQDAADLDPEAHFAHPAWLIGKIKKAWPDAFESILQANNVHAPMTLRVNLAKISREDYCQQLLTKKISAIPTAYSPSGLTLSTPRPVDQLPGFFDGLVSVQDGAAQLATELLACKPGDIVLDACAAPGGKTCHLLERYPDIARLVAIDQDATRLNKVAENMKRCHLSASLLCADATETDAWWDGTPFDRILLDAPCSATGVIRRHPDIKILRRPDDIDHLVTTQLRLLTALWPTLKSGGTLLYATCSVLPAENSKIIERFLAKEPSARSQAISADWGIPLTVGRQCLPGLENMDGFYYAILVK